MTTVPPDRSPARHPTIVIGLNAVIVAVTGEAPRILTVRAGAGSGGRALHALPFGPLDPSGDRTLELGLRTLVRAQTGLELGYVEQLYTFGDRDRGQLETRRDSRVVSVAYLALVREERLAAGSARWYDCYGLLPWEDWRSGRPAIIDEAIRPALQQWAAAAGAADARRARRDRIDITFGFHGAAWDGERALERYELLYEVGLADAVSRGEAGRRRALSGVSPRLRGPLGTPMVMDHRRMLATALSRLRGKIRYRPVVFELLPPTFTLLQLQRLVEALAGVRLHKGNFRRLVEQGGLVEGTGRLDLATGGRPAERFRFRREVLRERRSPGVGLPASRG